MRWRRRVYKLLYESEPGYWPGRLVDSVLLALLAGNVALIVAELTGWSDTHAKTIFWAELVIVGGFTLEYAGRLWSAPEAPGAARPARKRLRFALSPMGLIDLLAILPFYLPFIGLGTQLRIVRVTARLARLLRLAKAWRYLVRMARALRSRPRTQDA